MSDILSASETSAQEPEARKEAPPPSDGSASSREEEAGAPGSSSGPGSAGAVKALPQQAAPGTLNRWLSLSALDDIDPDNVRNSTAFKLGALAGLLPALSVMSLTQFMTPEQMMAKEGGAAGFSLGSGLAVLLSSALVGGSVAFFWAENRLRTIFTYGIAGPTVVLSMFLSGISNLAADKRVENVRQSSEQKIADEAEKIKTETLQQANLEVQKVNSAMQKVFQNVSVEPLGERPPPAPAAAPAASNPDLAAP
ncbi:MAG: hypothetical protein CJBNEKGG_01759 [Prosthecobacter sp.]|nr:hypothetical protein [Prosthecobacter sp.]